VDSRTSLDGCGESRPHRDSIHGRSNTQPVAISTELSQPTFTHNCAQLYTHGSPYFVQVRKQTHFAAIYLWRYQMFITNTHRYSLIHTSLICTSSNRPTVTVSDIPIGCSLWQPSDSFRRFPCTSTRCCISIILLSTSQSTRFLRRERKI
jgi:hypothetical protein